MKFSSILIAFVPEVCKNLSQRSVQINCLILRNVRFIKASAKGKMKRMYTRNFEVRHPRCVSNNSKCNVYTICRQTHLSTRWYANLLNVNLNYMFRPQNLAIIRLYKRKLIN
jgi:hypothetical protein